MTINRYRTAVLAMLCASMTWTILGAPTPKQNHHTLARSALQKDDFTGAQRELKLALQDNPLDAGAHFLLATLLAWDGELDQAMVGFQETVKLEPANAVANYNLGTGMLIRGEPLLAARWLENAQSLRPDHVPTYVNLAKAYYQTGLPELALASYREALRLDPANAIARNALAALQAAVASPGDSATDPTRSPGSRTNPPPALRAVLPEPTTTTNAVEDVHVRNLKELVRDLPHVTVERRGELLTLGGWTSGVAERKLLDRILAVQPDVLDLTGEDVGDPHRLLEVDAIILTVLGLDSESVGHDFLRQVTVNASVVDAATAGFSWLYSAAISYEVNIANASKERVAFLARPHLTTLSGTPATFIAGGDTVFKVSGTTSGDIKNYPFGTSLDITPTLLRTPGEDGMPRVHTVVRAGRKSILPVDSPEAQSAGDTVYSNVEVTSEAVVDLNQTLILTGLSQRERRESLSGIPGLKSIPVIKYLFSRKISVTTDLAIIILLTPRDPAFWDEQNRKELSAFVEKRRAYVKALHGTAEDMRRFKERYPDWNKLSPNRFATHFFLMDTSEAYRAATGMDLANETLDFDILDPE